MSVFIDGKGAYPNSRIDFDNSAKPRSERREDGSLWVKSPYGGHKIQIEAPKESKAPAPSPYI